MTAQRVAKRPRDIAACVSACLQAGDIDGGVALFHPDCEIHFPPGEPPHRGHAGVRSAFADLLPLRPAIHSEVIHEVVAGNTALVSADWQAVLPDGRVIAEGTSTEVARQLDHGGWGYLIDCPLGLPPVTT